MMKRTVIAAAVRTPFGRLGGLLRNQSAIDLGAAVTREALRRAAVAAEAVDETYFGTAVLASSTLVAARQINIRAGLPPHTPSLTVDRACCSSMTAIGLARLRIGSGLSGIIVAGGVESCSGTPHLQRSARWGRRLGGFTVEDPLQFRNPINGEALAQVTGRVAVERGVGRDEQDDWAYESHRKYFRAAQRGFFDGEIVPVLVKDGSDERSVSTDESPRQDISRAALGKLPTVYDSPTVTAGNAPGLSDGACAVVAMSEDEARRRGIEPMCEIVDHVQIAGPMDSSPYLPGEAVARLMAVTGVKLGEVQRIEINEAFAAMPPVSLRHLAAGSPAILERLSGITNVHGGAVALGHPTGASGARLVTTLTRALREVGGGYGVAAICGGFGQADAVLIKV